MKSLNGQIIRGYEIGERIGSGGYGEVYRATQLSVNRDVAVKVILPQYASNPVFIADFEAEAKLVAQLEHTNIVPLHDYWQDEQGAFLVMRYVRGGSLKEMIDRQGALPLANTTRLIEQIANALALAHDAGVVHRDLKPANILIDQRGSAYLTDFGIAKQLSGDDISGESGALKGTFAYMSPERIQGDKVSPQTDIYALGVILYEMFAGRHPFDALPIGTLLIKHMQEPLPDIHDIRDDLPYGIGDVIQKATEKDPTDRYSSALELVSDLKATLNSAPAGKSHPAVAAKTKPATLEERNRDAMLTNVRKFWVEGVLENSLHDAAMIDLGLKPKTGAVDNPWDTLIRTPSGDETLNDERIMDVFDRMNGKLLILGDPGSGKTTTLLALARDLLNRAESDNAHPIPVVLNLSSWSENQLPLKEWLVEELNARYQVPRRVGTAWIADDELLLLLDGLDEVAVQVRDACVVAINAFRNEHGFVDIVVCSRIKNYERLSGQLKLNGAIVIQPLNNTQIVEYLEGLGPDVAVINELIGRDAQLRELAQSPLMLSIMLLAFRGLPTDAIPDFDNIKQQRQHLFAVYVERMVGRRGVGSPYTAHETQHYLHWLAKTMQSQVKSVFNIEEMQPALLSDSQVSTYRLTLRTAHMVRTSIGLFVMGGLYGLLLQGHWLIWAIGLGLVGLVHGWMLIGDPKSWQYAITHIPIGILVSATFVIALAGDGLSVGEVISALAFGVIYSFFSYFICLGNQRLRNDIMSIVPKDQLRFSIRQLSLRPVLAGFVAATMYVVGYTPLVNPDATLREYIFAILLAGCFWSILFLSYSALTSETVEQRISPNDGMKRSVRNGIRMMLTMTILFALTQIAAFPAITLPIAIITASGVLFGASHQVYWTYGGFVHEQHRMLRYLLQREGRIPQNLAHFLDHAASLILLRKVGGGYIFVHRYLLEYFAALEPEKEKP